MKKKSINIRKDNLFSRKNLIYATVLLLMAIAAYFLLRSPSYEQQQEANREEQNRQNRADSLALKIGVGPTLDCLPLYVAEHHNLFATLGAGADIRLKHFDSPLDCDDAMLRGKIEYCVGDMDRARELQRRGAIISYATSTDASWQMYLSGPQKLRKGDQLLHRFIAVSRNSASATLAEKVARDAKLDMDYVFRIQVGDPNVRVSMMNGRMVDATVVTEPQATALRLAGHNKLAEFKGDTLSIGVMMVRSNVTVDATRIIQSDVLKQAWNAAVDSINKHGLQHYSTLIQQKCGVSEDVVNALPKLPFHHFRQPSRKTK